MRSLWRSVVFVLLGFIVHPAMAAQGLLSEVRFGITAHDAHPGWIPFDVSKFRFNQIEDVSFELLFRSPDIAAFHWIGSPKPNFGMTLNFDDQESMMHLGLTWQKHLFDSPVFVEGTIGAAVHDGDLTGGLAKMRPQGCMLEIYTAMGIGVVFAENFTATLGYEHISNRELCFPNYGLSNLGLKIGAKFD